MYPERKNPQYSEEGIRNFIDGNLLEIEAGRKPVVIYREPYRPYKKHPKYKGFLALYVHYLYVLGKIQKQQYPPRMTAKMKKDVMRFEQLREQFTYLRENGIETPAQMEQLQAELGDKLEALTKQRTILNVQKKKQKKLFDALADEQALAPAKRLYEEGHAGMEAEYAQHMEAVEILDSCGVLRTMLEAQNWPSERGTAGTQVEDVDLDSGAIHVRHQVGRIDGKVQEAPLKTKNAYRSISIGADAVSILREKKKQDGGRSEYVFPSPTRGSMSPDSVLKMLHRVLERARLPELRFHDLRHTFATLALQNGVDIKTVPGMQGHFSAGFTLDTYAHVTTAAQRQAADTMGDVLAI